ncbi:conserved exported hypothetical protein [Flavobacterium sp. 9AF]|uniref:hypothetical protein n=1 Tax=Flavobacterium sp. 9AF TaxID=2653142 RepID=UPI0012F1DD74|nr:hypothetical protein [Flavobacterium sp. 9AF]VXB34156.1 conserved exported hypothetical protein [Flavobacterium sp. 9AF]
MKNIVFIVLLFFSCKISAQIFTNRDSNSTVPKFTIENGKTHIYHKVGGKTELGFTFNEVPQVFDYGDGRTRAKMTVTVTDKVAKRTFVITYTLFRQTQKYGAGIEYTIDFHDKRPTKVLNEYFDGK